MAKAPKLLTVAAYLRLSKDDPASSSIEKQRDSIDRWVAETAPDAAVTHFTDDGVSGSKDVRRPARDELESRLADFDLLAVYSVDRLARSVVDLYRITKAAEDAGTRFVAVSQPSVETVSPTGRAMLGLLAVFATLEAETTGARVRATNDLRRSKGSRAAGGPAGFGLVRVGDKLRPDPATAPLVVEAVSRVIAGEAGIRAIASDWTRRGIPTARGGARWSHRAVSKLLKSPALYGATVDRTGSAGVLLDDDGLPLVDPEQALIDHATFQQLQSTLARRANVQDRRLVATGRGPLHGLLACSACGGPLYSARNARQPDRLGCRAVGCSRMVSIRETPVVELLVDRARKRHPGPIVETVTVAGPDTGRLVGIRAEVARAASLLAAAAPDERPELLARIESLSAAEAEEASRSNETTRDVELWGSFDEAVADAANNSDDLRRLLATVIERVVVLPGRRGGPAQPVDERVDIAWKA